MAESKSRLLYILKYLWQNTDAEHYATTADILAFLKGNGISCDRKTIPGDIAKLCDIGIDIEEERSRENRYSLSSHLFTLPEVKLLIDAVESSKFITAMKSSELADSQGRREIHQDRAGGLHSCDKKDEKVFENTLKFGLLIQSK